MRNLAISPARGTRVRLSLVALALLAACGPDLSAPSASSPIGVARSDSKKPSPDNVVVQWDADALQAIRITHPGPPIVARALAIVHTAMFDAWAAYDKDAIGTRLGTTLRRPANERRDANKQRAVSYAAYRALSDLFPSEIPSFNARMASLGYDPNDVTTDVTTAAGIGNVAAKAVIDYRHGDGSNQLGDLNPGNYSDYTGYTPVNSPSVISDPNRWQPIQIGLSTQRFIAPHWKNVTPFALTSASQFRPAVLPNQYPSAGYTQQADEVIAYSANLTDREKVIAEYWADGPRSELPPGHWCLFAEAVSRRDRHSVDEDVPMFFAMTNAVFDASIASWEAKRYFDSVRPVTAVHFLYSGVPIRAWAGPGLGTQWIDGKDWRPYQAASVVTPPFPEFISGHSIFSAAAAEVLKRYTGSDDFGGSVTIAAGSSRVEPGLVPATAVTLSWTTFSVAADEAGISRRYGGIHFIEGDVQSRALGRLIGKQAYLRAQQYINRDKDVEERN